MQTPYLNLLLSCSILIVVGCNAPLGFGGDTESKALSYQEYVAEGGDAWFDPVCEGLAGTSRIESNAPKETK